ncbi:MAG: VWA domain-containing protein [Myxococcales bacterium]|nr:VWA domain-containing protein [Myxococcales bacterium]
MIAHGIGWITFAILYGSLAAAVIVVFLLRLTRRGRAVSSTLIWQKVMGTTRSFWQELASLLVQLLLFLLICLALVDPRPPAAEINRRWIALVFDTSESMAAVDGDASRLRQAGRHAWQTIETLAPVDRVMIVAAGSTVEALTPFTSDREEIKKALGALSAGGGAPRMDDALAYVAAAFSYAGVGEKDIKQLIVITDRPDRVTPPQWPDTATTVVGAGSPAPNVAITSFAVRQTANLSDSYDALVEVMNYADAPAKTELAVYTPTQTLGVQTLQLAPGGRYSQVVGLPVGAAGKLTALLRKTEFADGGKDALPSDDAAFAFLPATPKARVLLVGGQNLFLRNALGLDQTIDLTTIPNGDYHPGLTARFDVVVFDKFAPAQPPAGSAIYFAPPPGGPFVVKANKKNPATTGWADGNPLLQHVTMSELHIEEARVLQPQDKDIVLMGHYDGALMLLRENGGRYLLGVAFDLVKSDFPIQPAFPIFLHNAVQLFSRKPEGEIRTGNRLGEKVELAVTPGRQQVIVQDPLDQKISVPVRSGRALFRPTVPGFYTYADADALRVLAVSLTDPEESDLHPTPGAALPTFPRSLEGETREIFWPWLVLAALVLIVLDLVLFYHGRLA